MRKLARQANLSVTTLYNLIGSREAILQALIDDSAGRLAASAPATRATRDPLRRAARGLTSMLDHMIANSAVMRPLVMADFSTGRWEKVGREDEGRHFGAFKGAVHDGVTEALARGMLRSVVDQTFLERQLYVAFELALERWAFGSMDDEAFRLRSLSGFHVALLAFAGSDAREAVERELRSVERKLARLKVP